MKRILFQGDSITDCGRDRQDFWIPSAAGRTEKRAAEGYRLGDGVHPAVHFHKLIADKWIRTLHGE